MKLLFLFCFVLWYGLAVNGQTLTTKGDSTRDKLIRTAESQLGIREKTGHNDGKEVERYLNAVHLGKGFAWCSAFLVWCHDQNGIENPRSAWAPDWFKANIVYKSHDPKFGQFLSKKGQVFGIYFESKKRVAHVGMIAGETKLSYVTIEGNTNDAGSREGDGVYRKIRNKRTIYVISDYCQTHKQKPP